MAGGQVVSVVNPVGPAGVVAAVEMVSINPASSEAVAGAAPIPASHAPRSMSYFSLKYLLSLAVTLGALALFLGLFLGLRKSKAAVEAKDCSRAWSMQLEYSEYRDLRNSGVNLTLMLDNLSSFIANGYVVVDTTLTWNVTSREGLQDGFCYFIEHSLGGYYQGYLNSIAPTVRAWNVLVYPDRPIMPMVAQAYSFTCYPPQSGFVDDFTIVVNTTLYGQIYLPREAALRHALRGVTLPFLGALKDAGAEVANITGVIPYPCEGAPQIPFKLNVAGVWHANELLGRALVPSAKGFR